MRITESMTLAIATRGQARATERLANATRVASSGLRVEPPPLRTTRSRTPPRPAPARSSRRCSPRADGGAAGGDLDAAEASLAFGGRPADPRARAGRPGRQRQPERVRPRVRCDRGRPATQRRPGPGRRARRGLPLQRDAHGHPRVRRRGRVPGQRRVRRPRRRRRDGGAVQRLGSGRIPRPRAGATSSRTSPRASRRRWRPTTAPARAPPSTPSTLRSSSSSRRAPTSGSAASVCTPSPTWPRPPP